MIGLKILFLVLWNSCSLHCKKLAFLRANFYSEIHTKTWFILKWCFLLLFLYSYFIQHKKHLFWHLIFLHLTQLAIVFYLTLKTANIGFNCCVRLSLSSMFMSQLCNSQVFAVSIFLKLIWYWIGLRRGWWHSE